MKHLKLRGRIAELGLSGEWLSEKLYMSACSFSHRMTGKTPWRLDEAYKILSLLGLPADSIGEYFPPNG